MHTIALEGMHFFAHHGFYDEEQLVGGNYEVAVQIDFTTELINDDLSKTVNYEVIYTVVKKVMAIPVRLIETIGQSILAELKALSSEIAQISIKISKLDPPLKGIVDRSVYTLKWEA